MDGKKFCHELEKVGVFIDEEGRLGAAEVTHRGMGNSEMQDIAELLADAYLNGEEPTNPYASPIYADLKGLPPLLIHVGSIEILLDDSISLAKHAKSAGVDTTLEIWEGMPHVFHNFGDKIPDSKKALESIKNFTKKHLK